MTAWACVLAGLVLGLVIARLEAGRRYRNARREAARLAVLVAACLAVVFLFGCTPTDPGGFSTPAGEWREQQLRDGKHHSTVGTSDCRSCHGGHPHSEAAGLTCWDCHGESL